MHSAPAARATAPSHCLPAAAAARRQLCPPRTTPHHPTPPHTSYLVVRVCLDVLFEYPARHLLTGCCIIPCCLHKPHHCGCMAVLQALTPLQVACATLQVHTATATATASHMQHRPGSQPLQLAPPLPQAELPRAGCCSTVPRPVVSAAHAEALARVARGQPTVNC